MHALLHASNSDGKFTVPTNLTIISGLGGIGKSELARKYAFEYGDIYNNNVIWIDADNSVAKTLGSDHPSTLTTKSNLANALSNHCKYNEALSTYKSVFDVKKKVLGHDHPSTLTTQSNMALVLSNPGKYSEALKENRKLKSRLHRFACERAIS